MNPIGNNYSRLTPLDPLAPLAPLHAAPTTTSVPATGAPGTFESVLGQVLGPVNDANVKADQAITALATGQAEDLHQVSLAVAQADLAFRMMLEMRNRLSDAYQEVTRMQV
ncbi:flagellar hook-basal body complex protein FliE [Zavarzinella formosa]|uniref:flagellar hook-basal body complex protein FliE n=1 Tax=Zavarzinella formosa TaxID=360055 RepID=UPI00030158A2|nr:flagellar hook-basal body complex protein FliE [Zavarzinella formosa]